MLLHYKFGRKRFCDVERRRRAYFTCNLLINIAKEFYEQFIDRYKPSRGQKIYEALIQFMKEYYLDDSYENIPIELKELVEENIINANIYDKIVVAAGFRQEILDKINVADKEVMVQTFTDINHYKGAVELSQRIGNGFDDKVSFYELLID